jgi:hypothetical protein
MAMCTVSDMIKAARSIQNKYKTNRIDTRITTDQSWNLKSDSSAILHTPRPSNFCFNRASNRTSNRARIVYCEHPYWDCWFFQTGFEESQVWKQMLRPTLEPTLWCLHCSSEAFYLSLITILNDQVPTHCKSFSANWKIATTSRRRSKYMSPHCISQNHVQHTIDKSYIGRCQRFYLSC